MFSMAPRCVWCETDVQGVATLHLGVQTISFCPPGPFLNYSAMLAELHSHCLAVCMTCCRWHRSESFKQVPLCPLRTRGSEDRNPPGCSHCVFLPLCPELQDHWHQGGKWSWLFTELSCSWCGKLQRDLVVTPATGNVWENKLLILSSHMLQCSTADVELCAPQLFLSVEWGALPELPHTECKPSQCLSP